jgi:hypothetical protein
MMSVMRCMLAAASLMLLYSACDDESSVAPKKSGVFEGILAVELPDCHIVGGDTTDFQPRPESQDMMPTNYSLIYACPNPTIGETWIVFQIPQQDSVWLFVYDKPGRMPIDTLYAASGPAGVYTINFENQGPLGIYRVMMHTASGFESYGDVEFRNELP